MQLEQLIPRKWSKITQNLDISLILHSCFNNSLYCSMHISVSYLLYYVDYFLGLWWMHWNLQLGSMLQNYPCHWTGGGNVCFPLAFDRMQVRQGNNIAGAKIQLRHNRRRQACASSNYQGKCCDFIADSTSFTINLALSPTSLSSMLLHYLCSLSSAELPLGCN